MNKGQMTKRTLLLMAVFITAVLWPPQAIRADEISDLKRQLEIQSKILAELQEKIAQLEARQKLKEESLTKQIEQIAQKAEEKKVVALPESIKWVENVKISGDFRYRYEHIDAETSGSTQWKKGRDRNRIRARLMLDAIVNDEWDVAFRLATGERSIVVEDGDGDMFADPISTNQSLRQHFSKKDFWLDLAYFRWHPSAIKELNVYGGKIVTPFYAAGKNELIWDHDLTPEGGAFNYAIPLGSKDKLHLTGGAFWVDESSSGVDASLWGVQGYLKHTIGNPDYILGGVSFFDYGNIQGKTDKYGILAGNTADATGTKWASDYDIIEVFGEYGTECCGWPVAFFGNWAQNTIAVSDEDKGWWVGAKLNKAEKPGSWEFLYNYREVDADAVFGAFTDSDFIGGGTDGKGHEFGFTYQLAKNLQAALTYFLNERTSSNLDYHRLQTDLMLKF